MPTTKDNRRCFLAIPAAPDFSRVRIAVERGVSEAGFEAVAMDEQSGTLRAERNLFAELARADCIVADISTRNAHVFFVIGQAFAMSKSIIILARESTQGGFLFDTRDLPFDVQDVNFVEYRSSGKGMVDLAERIETELVRVRDGARRGRSFSGQASMPFVIDWDRLDSGDIENLCRELLLQMGYRHVDWNKHSKDFDIVAELPRKDPDGYEYTELWLVSLGMRASADGLVDIASSDPEYLLHRVVRNELVNQRVISGRDGSLFLTLLFITLDPSPAKEHQYYFDKLNSRKYSRRSPIQIRVRLWDREYLTTLVQQFPQLGYKYFSDESRSLTKFRKGPEELYQENVQLTERLTKTVSDLESERNLRVRAERDAVWKDISFSAAHKIGNPIFAIETDLDPLRKRIVEQRSEEALEVTDNMRCAVEKAKGIVEQFKSLTKAQQVNPIPMALSSPGKYSRRLVAG